jgi:UDP-3-O-[3-hydroxymyristoyl] N-acetylglucosamine deacetylase/3-hydroxyacyl-[acyl-carrier-protein] dehydratase
MKKNLRAFSLIEISVVLLLVALIVSMIIRSSSSSYEARLRSAISITQASPVKNIDGTQPLNPFEVVASEKKAKEEMKKQAKQKHFAPAYNPNVAPLYDVNRIMETLPHRPPFLLVDKIIEMGEAHVIGVKNITMNEPFFQGHFPGNPVMPGVLQIEAMAQAGGILALSTVADPENYSTYFLKIDGVKFKAKVVPGDTLVFKLNLTEPIRRGIVQMHGEAFVGDKLVMEADLMAKIVKEKNLDK